MNRFWTMLTVVCSLAAFSESSVGVHLDKEYLDQDADIQKRVFLSYLSPHYPVFDLRTFAPRNKNENWKNSWNRNWKNNADQKANWNLVWNNDAYWSRVRNEDENGKFNRNENVIPTYSREGNVISKRSADEIQYWNHKILQNQRQRDLNQNWKAVTRPRSGREREFDDYNSFLKRFGSDTRWKTTKPSSRSLLKKLMKQDSLKRNSALKDMINRLVGKRSLVYYLFNDLFNGPHDSLQYPRNKVHSSWHSKAASNPRVSQAVRSRLASSMDSLASGILR